ncbi:MAG: cyclic nucleotide-binding domain-containing protein [Archangium sp.]|nr:cyclic nucleotide-binding domain-containing protein [Archangium sp.]
MSQRFGDNTPVVKVELKRADAAELIASKVELSGAPLVKALAGAMSTLLPRSTLRRYPDKVVLMQQGEEGDSLFFVMAGDVRLFARRDKDSAELGVVHLGGVLGESEVLAGEGGRRCSAVAQGQVDVLEFPRAALLVGGKLPPPLVAMLENVKSGRMKALDEMSDFLNRW